MNNAGCFSQNVARLAITDSKGAVCGRRQNWRESGLTLQIFEASDVLIELVVVWNLKCQETEMSPLWWKVVRMPIVAASSMMPHQHDAIFGFQSSPVTWHHPSFHMLPFTSRPIETS